MADNERFSIKVSVAGSTKYDGDIIAYFYNRNNKFIGSAQVQKGKVDLPFNPAKERHNRVFFGPPIEDDEEPQVITLKRISAFEAVLYPGDLVDHVRIPGNIVDLWPLCFCLVTGRVIKDGRPVCNAVVHICEVDRYNWILVLPEFDILRLRDDLIRVLEEPRIKWPPRPDPVPDFIQPGFEIDEIAVAPRAVQPRRLKRTADKHRRPATPAPNPVSLLPNEVQLALNAQNATTVRRALIDHFELLHPYLCLTPIWWRYTCDELGVVTTDASGRFSLIVPYNCFGDKPDIYVWVEFEIGGVLETVYRPPIACYTYWNYACGTDIVITITDPRVPTCDPEPDLGGCVVSVMSIGNAVSISEIQSGGPREGQTTANQPFGATLEPRVDFSRTALIAKGITHYLWSYRRLTGPDGTTPVVDTWHPMDRDVYRHYRVFQSGVLSYPSFQLGPDPAGPKPNSFKIKPTAPPAPGTEWVTLNQHVDLASGYFETRNLSGAPQTRADGDDTSAGLYELKFELFKTGSANPIEWETEGVDLKIADVAAPFPTGTVSTITAPNVNRIIVGGKTVAFRMVLRVDNNFCTAEVFDASGSAVNCGIIQATAATMVQVGFRARHPNNFATYDFEVERGDGTQMTGVETSGVAGESNGDGYVQAPAFEYRNDYTATSLLAGGCRGGAAFAQEIEVYAMAVNGYTRLNGYDHEDLGAFALVPPCP